MTPHRIQLKRARGWRKPAAVVVVTRPGPWGNPFAVEETAGGWLLAVKGKAANDAKVMDIARKWNEIGALGHRAAAVAVAVEAFRQLHDNEISRHAIRHALKGRSLACWCPLGTPCHADVLLAIANDEAPTTCGHTTGQPTAENPDFPAPERQRNAPRPAAVEILTTADGPFPACFYTEEGLECSCCSWHGCEAQALEREDPVNGLMHDCPECGEECAHCPIDEIRPNPAP